MKHMMVLALGATMMAAPALMAQDVTGGAGSTANPNLPSQGGMMKSQNQAGTLSPQDQQFLQKASPGNYTEITFSQLAVQKASSPQVKAFAQKMVDDHQKLMQEMQPFAQQAGVTAPTALDAEHQQAYDQLNQLSGSAFDKQYMADMDKDHHMTLDAFKSELSSTQDKQFKRVVMKGERVVAEHTRMADKLQMKLGAPAAA